jgi:hypothetical protein
VLFTGETVRLLRALSEPTLPQFAEGRVIGILRNEHNEPAAVEVEFHRDSQTIKAEVHLEDVELVISDSEFRQTAVFWGLDESPAKVIETAMHSLLDSGFLMRDGPTPVL